MTIGKLSRAIRREVARRKRAKRGKVSHAPHALGSLNDPDVRRRVAHLPARAAACSLLG